MSEPAAKPKASSPWILGPLADRLLLIYSPLIAVALGVLISRMALAGQTFSLGGRDYPILRTFVMTFTAAHLVIVFVRSHANPVVFARFPLRFTLVPLLLFSSMMLSVWVAAIALTIGIWWDVYHSGMQTFGLGRIYDRKAGNDPNVGRTLDWILNTLIYLGPILAGATLLEHAQQSFDFYDKVINGEDLGMTVTGMFFARVPGALGSNQRWMTLAICGFGVPFTIFYLVRYWQLSRQGYQVSNAKAALYSSTAVCSIFTWGFNSFGTAFFIMNFFHALQYFAIIWWSEGGRIRGMLGLPDSGLGRGLALLALVVGAFGYGAWVALGSSDIGGTLFSLALSVSLLHFWYDGFIWSVRKQHV